MACGARNLFGPNHEFFGPQQLSNLIQQLKCRASSKSYSTRAAQPEARGKKNGVPAEQPRPGGVWDPPPRAGPKASLTRGPKCGADAMSTSG
ncbi:unnamed protein product [Prunus armeniaca]